MSDPVEAVLSRLQKVTRSGDGWTALCPGHEDRRASLSIGRGDDGRALLHCHRGCAPERIAGAIGLEVRELFADAADNGRRGPLIIATYDYRDERGELLYQAVRLAPKDFRLRRPDGAGGWTWRMGDTRRVLYRLPEVLAAVQAGRTIYIVEGEKDADALARGGLAATTNATGAGKWRREYVDALRDANVCIVPDHDDAGRAHAEDVARSLHGTAAEVRVLELEGLAEKGDVSDWLAAGGTVEELDELAFDAPMWTGAQLAAAGEDGAADDRGADTPRVFDPRDPLAIARQLIADRYTLDGRRVILAHRGDLRAYAGSHYAELEEAGARAELYAYLERAQRPAKGGGGAEPFRPTAAAVSNVLDALRGAAHVPAELSPPMWLDGRRSPPPREVIACANGLLHIPTRTLLPHDPAFYTLHAVPYEYGPQAPDPAEWLAFLGSLWPDDTRAADTLQEVFGYLLAGETRLQKMFLIVGPRRSGKGTIGRVAGALIGTENMTGPTLSSLTTNFGLQSLIDRPLAIISDARLSGRADAAIVVERLLSISGEDVLTVDQKHREAWIGQLPTRIVILTNELPRLADTSGALASRFVVLTMTKSWYGREDTGLFERLALELPGILRWALDGWDRLHARGHIVSPKSSVEAVQELEDLASPIGAFVRDRCIIEPGAEIAIGALYSEWRRWCEGHGRDKPGTEQTFGRDLRAAVPGLTTTQRSRGGRDDREKWRSFVGIRPRDGGDL